MAWADQLPEIRAKREAWQTEHLPRLRERDAKQRADRDRVSDLIQRGLKAINATDDDRALVFDKTGFSA